jgi:peptide/nickel transport system permease protein
MQTYIIKRLLLAGITLLAVLTLIFFIVRIVPGDPARVVLGEQATMEAIEAMRARLGLDQPLWVQYARFLRGALSFDVGTSMVTGAPVLKVIGEVLPSTLELSAAAMVLGCILGIPLGIWSAVRRNRITDYVIRVASLLGLSFPAFVSAILLLLAFAISLRWFPVMSSGNSTTVADHLRQLALPAINLALIFAAYITRVSRSAMLEILREDYMRTAVAKGVPPLVVICRHGVRNALIPVVTVTGLYLGILIGNSVLTEIVFNRPGLGKLIVGSLAQRDYTMLQGLMVVYTMIVVVVSLATDLAYGFIDPRIRYE